MNQTKTKKGVKELVRAGELSARAAYISLLGRGYATGGQEGMEVAKASGAGRWLRRRIKEAGQKVPELDRSMLTPTSRA